GLGEDLGNLVNGSVQTTAQQVLRPATGLASEVPNTLSIHTGESGILTAPETGASSTTEAGAMIETRSVSTMYSAAETSIEAFMSRYAMFSAFDLRTGSTAANGEYRILDLRFSEESSTHKALVAKYRMFTYLRMGYDVVAIVSPKANIRDRVHMSSPPKFQMMFIPPGCPAPRLVDGPEWYLPTTPSVYFSVDQPPASLRLPYMGVMSTFASRYDGFYSFQTTNPHSYGYFPGNDIGKLAIRAVTDGVTANSDLVDYRVVIFARPTMIRAWLPRPIKSLKTQVSVSRSKGRVIFTDDDDADQLLIGQ
nr:VP1 [Bat picornavirus 3]